CARLRWIYTSSNFDSW
nr:immunoglobulin heavy chain junction region [Macaca mulatta]